MGLAGVELILSIEDRFHIVIAGKEAMQVTTVRDLQNLITQKLCPPQVLHGNTHSDDEWTDDRIWQAMVETIVDEMKIPSESVTPDKNFWRDICRD
ncbi:MAG TPA: hypothetical protein VHV83_12790 [Armatimonadota bacterium]|nr:hypothetical protein [Armatimonadota bacterium]